MIGTLHIVSTPIGNLGDITLRAIETLKSVDLIAAEDTRTTRKLTTRFDIRTPLTSFYEHNKGTKADYLIKALREGKNVALVSEAGTPGISDPGFSIIARAIKEDIPVTAIPGPSASIMALVLSGKPTHKFVFEGFLSNKSGARRKRLEALKKEERTIIFYESPHRILKMLKDLLEIMGDKEIAVARELTKKFEEVRRGRVSEILDYFNTKGVKGEFVVVV
ncbi:MAG: 16S rRNA (cytidine(1402)-2'-O)-methyltransferase [Candidatus Omnitrophica bacterium]|nr:16S rRNA (cytidine(1402)-2'-O)-methyltransferase [Candidatus Omnitrophota bacterium]